MKHEFNDITPKSLLNDLLTRFPNLIDSIVEISPLFQKLKNPAVLRAVGNVTTLQQIAAIGGVQVSVLINNLRKAAGLEKIEVQEIENNSTDRPNWVRDEHIKITYDASIDLENGVHPAAKVTKEILQLNGNDLYLLITPFLPVPLIKIVDEQGFRVYSQKISEQVYHNYITNKSV
ncbi:MAG: hypothetical protein CVV23_13120 [Ignavibacteriae bacterium HGW-Ignavibacteriae-2]|jgi:hypothetical protein|nr:MAG: hypothetical protein CVV23_13120 [Ignavibacteriae bacterium HGW-Ignavibacteriae-2]